MCEDDDEAVARLDRSTIGFIGGNEDEARACVCIARKMGRGFLWNVARL